MWVFFTRDYDFHVPGRRSIVAYPAHTFHNVTRACYGAAMAAGAALPALKTARDKEPEIDRRGQAN